MNGGRVLVVLAALLLSAKVQAQAVAPIPGRVVPLALAPLPGIYSVPDTSDASPTGPARSAASPPRRPHCYSSRSLSSNAPLFVVNGKVKSRAWVNRCKPTYSNRIETVEVLRPAQAVASYGAKGRNGAVLLTVKNKQLFTRW
jgi:hypothetical protein